MPSPKKWSSLPKWRKDAYHEQGVTAATYNRWNAMPERQRRQLSSTAKATGYKGGLQFLAIQSRIRYHGGRKVRIKPTTPTEQAVNLLVKGTHGKENKLNRHYAAELLGFNEFDKLDWQAAMGSP